MPGNFQQEEVNVENYNFSILFASILLIAGYSAKIKFVYSKDAKHVLRS